MGFQALYDSTGNNNTAFGYRAGYEITTGVSNVCVGDSAQVTATTGNHNTSIGSVAGGLITTGAENTCLGSRAGYGINTGSNNVCLGYEAGRDQLTTASNQLYIARDNIASSNPQVWIYGNGQGACHQGNNSSTWTTTSDVRLKKNITDNSKGLTEINQLRVTNFEYKTEDEIDMSEFPLADNPNQVVIGKGKEGEIQTGVIAQEIESILPECIEVSERGAKTVSTDPIMWALVNAVKELSAKNDALAAEVEQLKSQLNN